MTALYRINRRGSGINIRFDESRYEHKAKDGTVLLTVEKKIPVIAIAENIPAADKMNEYIRTFDFQDISVEEAMKQAEADYRKRGADNWHGYSLGLAYTSERIDDRVISFLADAYSDMGGAHPNSVRAAINFSPDTGNRLTLADITKDRQSAVKAIEAAILEQTKQDKYTDILFEDYKDHIGELLTEDTWYLGGDGFHVIGNEYIISPHVAGILDFVIPYGEAGFLKEEYRRR